MIDASMDNAKSAIGSSIQHMNCYDIVAFYMISWTWYTLLIALLLYQGACNTLDVFWYVMSYWSATADIQILGTTYWSAI